MFERYNHKKFWKRRQEIINTKNPLKKFILFVMYQKELRNNCAVIPIRSFFKEAPVLPHGLSGIFISEKAEIGKGVTIFQQVTIGANTIQDSRKYGAPKVGDNCYIGAGAKIIGNITVGDNVRIGANCVVTEDIPSNSTVVLQKPRILNRYNKK